MRKKVTLHKRCFEAAAKTLPGDLVDNISGESNRVDPAALIRLRDVIGSTGKERARTDARESPAMQASAVMKPKDGGGFPTIGGAGSPIAKQLEGCAMPAAVIEVPSAEHSLDDSCNNQKPAGVVSVLDLIAYHVRCASSLIAEHRYTVVRGLASSDTRQLATAEHQLRQVLSLVRSFIRRATAREQKTQPIASALADVVKHSLITTSHKLGEVPSTARNELSATNGKAEKTPFDARHSMDFEKRVRTPGSGQTRKSGSRRDNCGHR